MTIEQQCQLYMDETHRWKDALKECETKLAAAEALSAWQWADILVHDAKPSTQREREHD